MAGLPNFIEGAAFGVLNDILAGFRDNNGFAQPNRYEIIIIPPAKIGGGGNENISLSPSPPHSQPFPQKANLQPCQDNPNTFPP